MEKAIKEGTPGIDPFLAEFGSQLKVVMNGIRRLEESLAAKQKSEKPAGEAKVDKEAVKTLLKEMAQLLESDMTEAMNRLEALRHHLANSSAYEGLRMLEKQVESFDTDSALISLEAIARALDIEL